MKFRALLLVLVVLQASAKPQPNASFQSNDFNNFNGMSGAYGSSLPVINTHIQTSVVENPTVTFPSFIPPSTISESCHCLKTLVRPQIRNEFISVPAVDRIVRTVSTPVVETINCGGGTRMTTFTPTNILSGVTQIRNLSEGAQNTDTKKFSNGKNTGKALAGQSTNSQNEASNTVNYSVMSKPSVFTFQALAGRNLQGLSNVFSDNSGFLNRGRINGF